MIKDIQPQRGTYKVKITSGSLANGLQVVFEASSQISEGRSVNYQQNDITHMPTDIWSYRNTAARHFEITGKLVSRTPSEAMANAYYVDVIRSWALPDFGNSGATPPILSLSAFYNKNINKVPCVLKSYGITYPDDVDWIYINTDGSQLNDPMPVICIIQVSLEEAYSPSQITNMDWQMTMLTAKDVVSKAPPFFVYGQPGYYDGGAQPTIGQGYSDTSDNFAGLGTLTKSQINALANSGTSTAAIAAQQVVLANAQANATNAINAPVQPNGFNPNANAQAQAQAQANATNTINAPVQPNGFNPNAIQITQPTSINI